MLTGNKSYDVLYGFGIETEEGYWPDGDLVEKLYSRKGVNYELFHTFDNNHCGHSFGKYSALSFGKYRDNNTTGSPLDGHINNPARHKYNLYPKTQNK